MPLEERLSIDLTTADIPEIIARVAAGTMPRHPVVYWTPPILRLLRKILARADDATGIKLLEYIQQKEIIAHADFDKIVDAIGGRFALVAAFTGDKIIQTRASYLRARLYIAAEEENPALAAHMRANINHMDRFAIYCDNWMESEGRTTRKSFVRAIDESWDDVWDDLAPEQKIMRGEWERASDDPAYDLTSLHDVLMSIHNRYVTGD